MPQHPLPAVDPGLPISREQLEQHVEALIDLLDSLDEDPDFEPDTDAEPDQEGEPSLGSINPTTHGTQQTWAAGTDDDREDEHDGAEPSEDAEPSLGWTDNPNQDATHYAQTSAWGIDLEQGTGPVRKKRPRSKTGGNVYRGCRVLGCPPTTNSSTPTQFRVRSKGEAK